MKDMNKIFLLGRLGADPVRKETKNGNSLAYFPVATSRRLPPDENNPGVKNEETQWHRVVVWGKQGVTCAQYLKKGQSVMVEGSVRSRKYNTQEGEEKFLFEVHADNICFLGGGMRNGAAAMSEIAANA